MLSAAMLSLGIGRVIPARAIQYDLLTHDFERYTILNSQTKTAKNAIGFSEDHNPELYSEENTWSFRLLPSIYDIYYTAASSEMYKFFRKLTVSFHHRSISTYAVVGGFFL